MSIPQFLAFVLVVVGVVAALFWFMFGSQDEQQEQRDPIIFEQPKVDNELPDVPVDKVVPTDVGTNRDHVIPLDQFVASEGSLSPQFSSVLDSVHLDSYIVFPCVESGTNVILLTAKYTEVPDGINTYEPAFNTISAWEPNMLDNFQSIIYPGAYIPKQTLSFSIFEDEEEQYEYKQADVFFGVGRGVLVSMWVGNYVYYGSSKECVFEAAERVYSPHSH